MTPAGMIVGRSPHGARATVDRIRQFVEARGLKVFAQIEHDGAAAAVGLDLPFTQVLVFGDPRAGTPLMRATPTLAIDLPLRILVWADAAGDVWIGHDDPQWIAARHAMLPGTAPAFEAMHRLLANAAAAATGTVP